MKNLFLFLVFFNLLCFAEDYRRLDCVLNVQTNYSGKLKESIEEILIQAEENNIECVILNDYFLRKYEFGIKPFQNIIKKSFLRDSVLKNGLDKYLYEIDYLQKKYPDIILIDGVSVTPHYFYKFEKLSSSFIINNFHRNFLIFGAREKKFYKKLPVVGNKLNAGEFNYSKIFFVLVILILFLYIKLKLVRSILFISGFYLILYWFPFKDYVFDQYSDFGNKPYDFFANYVNSYEKKIPVICSHPEAKISKEEPLFIALKAGLKVIHKTEPYTENLKNNSNYTGFGIFPFGFEKVGEVGGIWDENLLKYITGEILQPMWAYSEVFKDDDDIRTYIYQRKNVLLVKDKSYEGVVDALINGRFYCVWRTNLDEIKLENYIFISGRNSGTFGEKIKYDGDAKIKFELKTNKPMDVNVYIINDGKVLENIKTTTPTTILFKDRNELTKKKSYYRIFIKGPFPNMVATNPNFLELD